MNVTIKINCDNAAFDDSPESEVARILQVICRDIETGQAGFPSGKTSYGGMTYDLRDYNGNRCGTFSVKG